MFNTGPHCNIARDLEGRKAPAALCTVSVCAPLQNKRTMQLPRHLLTHVAFCLTMLVDNGQRGALGFSHPYGIVRSMADL